MFLVILSFIACSENGDQTDPIIGSWQGDVIQPGFGTIAFNITLSKLEEEAIAGQLNSEVTDISNCDDSIFFCEFGTCTAQWIYKGRNGSTYLFFEKQLAGSDCGDGNIEAKITSSDELSFSWTDVTDSSNISSGILRRT